MPPIFSAGKMAIAMTMIPIPPTQFMMQRQNNTDFGSFSKPENTVEPVVVNAETVSNQASVTVQLGINQYKGKDPNKQMINQLRVVSKNSCRFLRRN
jgi:hypothetical protein